MDKKYKDFDPGQPAVGDIYLLADPVTSVLKKVVVKSSTLVNKYSALLTQSGTGDPIANIFESDFTITWTRVSMGVFNGNSTGAFISGKTFINPNNSTVRKESAGDITETGILIERIDDDNIQITTDDDILFDFPILIITKS